MVGNQNIYPPAANQRQPYQHDQYNMYQPQQISTQTNQGHPNYPPPYSQPGYGHVIQHQPNAYQPPPQVLSGWYFLIMFLSYQIVQMLKTII